MDIRDLMKQVEAKRAAAEKLLTKADMTPEDFEAAKKLNDEKDQIQARVNELAKALNLEDRAPLGTINDGDKKGRPFANLGEQAVAIARASGNNAQIDRRLYEVQAASGMSETVPYEGGWLVQTDESTELLQNMYQNNQLLSQVRRFQISSNANGIDLPVVDETSRAVGYRLGGVRAYWKAEADSVTASKPKIKKLHMSLEDMMALCYVTQDLIDDAPALGSFLNASFGSEFEFVLQDAAVRGDGSGKMLGALNAPCLVTVSKETGQAADTIEFQNIVKMWSRLPSWLRTRAIWAINQDVEPQLYSMSLSVGTGGVPVYLPAGGLSATPYGTLFGRPVVPIEQADTIGDLGDIILGAWSEYFMIEKGGIQGAQSIHLKFDYAETAFRWIYRCNGRPWWSSTLTPAYSSNTLSPFVTLEAR